jgi:hypothetical protein
LSVDFHQLWTNYWQGYCVEPVAFFLEASIATMWRLTVRIIAEATLYEQFWSRSKAAVSILLPQYRKTERFLDVAVQEARMQNWRC